MLRKPRNPVYPLCPKQRLQLLVALSHLRMGMSVGRGGNRDSQVNSSLHNCDSGILLANLLPPAGRVDLDSQIVFPDQVKQRLKSSHSVIAFREKTMDLNQVEM